MCTVRYNTLFSHSLKISITEIFPPKSNGKTQTPDFMTVDCHSLCFPACGAMYRGIIFYTDVSEVPAVSSSDPCTWHDDRQ